MARCRCKFDTLREWLDGGGTEVAHARAHREHHERWAAGLGEQAAAAHSVAEDLRAQVIGRLEFRIARLEEIIERLLGITVPPTCEADALIRSSVQTPEVTRG